MTEALYNYNSFKDRMDLFSLSTFGELQESQLKLSKYYLFALEKFENNVFYYDFSNLLKYRLRYKQKINPTTKKVMDISRVFILKTNKFNPRIKLFNNNYLLDLDRREEETYMDIGNYFFNKKKWKDAVFWYEKSMNRGEFIPCCSLITALKNLKRNKEAAVVCMKMLTRGVKAPYLFLYAAQLHQEGIILHKNIKKAFSMYQKAMEMGNFLSLVYVIEYLESGILCKENICETYNYRKYLPKPHQNSSTEKLKKLLKNNSRNFYAANQFTSYAP